MVLSWILTILSISVLIYSGMKDKLELVYPVIFIVFVQSILPLYDLQGNRSLIEPENFHFYSVQVHIQLTNIIQLSLIIIVKLSISLPIVMILQIATVVGSIYMTRIEYDTYTEIFENLQRSIVFEYVTGITFMLIIYMFFALAKKEIYHAYQMLDLKG